MIPFYEHNAHRVFSVPPTSLTFPPHLHNAIECALSVSGQNDICIDGQHYLLRSGEIAVIFPNIVHSYSSDIHSDNQCALFIFPVKSSSPLYSFIKDKKPSNPILSSSQIHPDIIPQFHEVVNLLHNQPEKTLLPETLIQLILARLIENFDLISAENTINDNIIEKALSYIADNFKNQITLNSIAKHFGVSKYYLSRTLKTSLQMGICCYINNVRVDYAKSLLSDTNLSISEIALESGYENMRSFNRCFKEITAVSPSEFRKLCQNKTEQP